jgi:hypothetical protein
MVTGRHSIETERPRPREQPVELEMTVAFDTRVGRESLGVIGYIRIHHVLIEIFTKIEHEMLESELLRNPPGIVDITHGATTRVGVATPQFQRDTDNLVSFVAEHRGGNRRIHTSGHSDKYLHDRLLDPERTKALDGRRDHDEGLVDITVGARPSERQTQ